MKIMIVSPYTTGSLRGHLKLKEYGPLLKAFINKRGLSQRVEVRDVAPWVGQLIEELEKQPKVELYSVSPQIKMCKAVESFQLGKTTYYFYSSDYSSALRMVCNYCVWRKWQNCGRRVRRIAAKIKPDLVIVYGTENPVVSTAVMSLIHQFPVLCVIQTIYNNPAREKYNLPNRLIQELERDVIAHAHFLGTEDRPYYDLIMGMNPRAVVVEYPYPRTPFPALPEQEKIFDFVNYAFSMDARKGDEDSLRALAIVKHHYPNVTLNIAGALSEERRAYLNEIVDELGLSENVSFTPMFERKEDMLLHVMQARFAVLPVKLDMISTTTREAMYYRLPVVTSITPATPALNRDKPCVLLAEKGNIAMLGQKMLELMEDESFSRMLAQNAYEYLEAEMDNKPKVEILMGVFNAIIAHQREGAEVPRDLLFDIAKHPILG